MERNFDTVCRYGELRYNRREGPSKAKDLSCTYYYNHWKQVNIMALFEGEKRTLRGHDKPEVCWICIDEFGELSSIPARHLRMMDSICGFGFVPGVWEVMEQLLEWAEERNGK